MMLSWVEKHSHCQVKQELKIPRELLKEEGQHLLILLQGVLEIPLALMQTPQRCERNMF